eukprot:COSAG04_NODE_2586_length_3891_cov_1.352848_1_plen_24_part_10
MNLFLPQAVLTSGWALQAAGLDLY